MVVPCSAPRSHRTAGEPVWTDYVYRPSIVREISMKKRRPAVSLWFNVANVRAE
jgi:hypothetical protein